MSVFSLTDFAAHLLTVEADLRLAQEAAVVKGCKMIQRTAKAMIGHEQPLWPSLKPETIAHKARGNTPLLETGETRASIQITAPVDEDGAVVGYVGSDDKVAVYQELGTRTIPPRSFLGAAAMGNERAIQEMAGRLIAGALERGGPDYRELRGIMHILRDAGREIKKLGEEILDDDNDESDNRRK